MCEWNRKLIIQDIVLAIVINTTATLLGHDPLTTRGTSLPAWRSRRTSSASSCCPPAPGRALTGWARDAKWRVYAQIFVENLIFVTIISLTEAWVHTGGAGIVAAWLATYVQLVLVGYVTSVVLFRVLE